MTEVDSAHRLVERLVGILGDFDLVDLSHVLSEDMPMWPGHMLFSHKVHNWYEAVPGPGQPIRSVAPYFTCWYTIDEHCGTHFDAPPHFIPPERTGLPNAGEFGSLTGERVSLDQLRGPGVVVDVRELAAESSDGVSPRITPDFLRGWEAAHGELCPGDVVILRTGWDAYWTGGEEGLKFCWRPVVLKDYPGWPAPSAEAVVHLYDRGVRLLCTDAPSVGAVDEQESMHIAGLERGMLYVECLTNLRRLPTRGAYFTFLPLKIAGSSGGNGRAAALVPSAMRGGEQASALRRAAIA